MDDRAIIKRKIELKDQEIELIAADQRLTLYKLKSQRKHLIYKLALLGLKDTFEGQIEAKFDLVLSRKIDCLTFLLDNWS